MKRVFIWLMILSLALPAAAQLPEGDRAFAQHNYAEALNFYRQALQKQPTPELHLRLLRTLAKLTRWDDYLAALATALKAVPDTQPLARARLLHDAAVNYLVLPHQGFRRDGRIYRDQTHREGEAVWLYQQDRQQSQDAFQQARALYRQLLSASPSAELRREVMAFNTDFSNFWLSQLVIPYDVASWPRLEPASRFPVDIPVDATALSAVWQLYQENLLLARSLSDAHAEAVEQYRWARILLQARGDSAENYPHQDPLALLQELLKRFPRDPLAPEWQLLVGDLYNARGQYASALEIWQGLQNSPLKEHAAQRLQELTWPRLNLSTPGAQPPGTAARFDLQGRNLDTIRFELYRVPLARVLQDPVNLYRPQQSLRDYVANLGGSFKEFSQVTEKVKEWSYTPRPDKPYAPFNAALQLPEAMPAGAYLLAARTDKVQAAVLMVLSNVILTSRQDNHKVIYFLADALSGRPISGAQLSIKEVSGYSPQQQVRAYRVQTDERGMYTFQSQTPAANRNFEAFAVWEDQYALSNMGYWYDSRQQAQQWKIYAYTDRPLYRPGQKIYFRQQLRLYRDGKYSLADKAPAVSVAVSNANGEEIYRQTLQPNRFGSLHGELSLPADAVLGAYHFSFRGPDGSYLPASGSNGFQVEEYKKPEFEVKVLPQPAHPGETAQVTLQASYFFGGPVAGGQVQYTVSRQDYWPDWSAWSEDLLWQPRQRSGRQVVLQSSGTLGADGRLDVRFPTQAGADSTYTIEAQVTDSSRREIVSTGQLVVTRQGFFAHILLDRGFYQPQDRISAEIRLQDANRQPVVDQAGQVTIERIVSEAKDKITTEPVYTQPVTSDDKGLIFVRWQSTTGGKYRLRFSARDRREQQVEDEQAFWVGGAGFAGQAVRLQGVELITDKRSYAPGEVVSLLVQADRADSFVWLTQESDDAILDSQLLELKGRSQQLRFTLGDQHQPNFMLRALSIADRNVNTDQRELFVPALQHRLQVSLTPDKADYAPGASGKLRISVKDADGAPVAGEFSLAMVDAALYQILPDTTQPIHDALYGERRNLPQRLDTSLNNSFGGYVEYLVKQKSFDLKDPFTPLPGVGAGGRRFRLEDADGLVMPAPSAEAAPANRQDSFGELKKSAAEAEAPAPRMRGEFKDTAYWNPLIVTDAAGQAELKLDFPDNLTTWRLISRGWNAGSAVGQAETEVKTHQDLMLRLQHPRFLTESDEVTISANLNSELAAAEAVSVRLQIDATMFQALTPLEQKASVPAKGQTRVDWRLKVLRPGAAVLSAEARGPHAGDAMRDTLPVQIYGSLRTENHSGSTRSQASQTLNLPAARNTDQTRLRISLQPSLAATLLDALPYLAEYPYGCIEQTTSRFVPAVLVAHTLNDLGIRLEDLGKQLNVAQRTDKQPLASRQQLQAMIDEGLRRLRSGQNSNGGWGWWPGGESDPYMSAYVLDALQLAQSADLPVEASILSHGLDYLAGRFTRTDNLHLKTYQAYVLAQARRLKPADLEPLFTRRDDLNAYSKALLAMAYQHLGSRERAGLILQNLKSFVRRDAASGTASWDNASSWWYWYGDRVETNATMLQAFNAIAPDDPLVPELMRWLVDNREGNRWHSTKDTARAIYALDGYLRHSHELKADYSVAVRLNGKTIGQLRFTPDKALAGAATLELADRDLKVGENRLELVKTGEGTLYYTAELEVFSREAHIPAAGNRIEIKRSYARVSDQVDSATGQLKTARTPLVEGAMLRSGEEVEVRLELKSPNDYEYLSLEDFKPAGFEAVDTLSGYVYQNGTGIYRELRDNRVAMFLGWMPQGTQILTYRLRAEIPGVFHALPHRVQAMYAPQISATSDSMVLGVKD